jgi:DNA-binding beta-propeller fold protein YncE
MFGSVKNIKRILLTICLQLMLGQLSGQSETPPIVWPDPPQSARIQYVESIYTSYDLGEARSLFARLIDAVLGRDIRGSSLIKPIDVTVDRHGIIYVADPGARCVHIFDKKESEYFKITSAGEGLLASPVGVVVSSAGNIYVSDSKRGAVFVYNKKRKYQYTIDQAFTRPTGIDIHEGRLYVVDTALHKVYVLDLDGVFLMEFGENGTETGQFNYPVFLNVYNDNIYVTDAMNFRVQVLSRDFENILTFGEMGDVQGTFTRPKGIAVDSDSNIYVADGLFNAFQIFNSTGQLLLVVGRGGNRAGEFEMPAGMHIDDQDKIYVADTMNRRIQIFQYLKVAE